MALPERRLPLQCRRPPEGSERESQCPLFDGQFELLEFRYGLVSRHVAKKIAAPKPKWGVRVRSTELVAFASPSGNQNLTSIRPPAADFLIRMHFFEFQKQ